MIRFRLSLIQVKSGLDPSGPSNGPAASDEAPKRALFCGRIGI